jgi:hypothetical protein
MKEAALFGGFFVTKCAISGPTQYGSVAQWAIFCEVRAKYFLRICYAQEVEMKEIVCQWAGMAEMFIFQWFTRIKEIPEACLCILVGCSEGSEEAWHKPCK